MLLHIRTSNTNGLTQSNTRHEVHTCIIYILMMVYICIKYGHLALELEKVIGESRAVDDGAFVVRCITIKL